MPAESQNEVIEATPDQNGAFAAEKTSFNTTAKEFVPGGRSLSTTSSAFVPQYE
jgi:hypothetical protein